MADKIMNMDKLYTIIKWCNENQEKIICINLDCELGVPFDNMQVTITLGNEQEIIFYDNLYDIGADEDIEYKVEDIERILNTFSK